MFLSVCCNTVRKHNQVAHVPPFHNPTMLATPDLGQETNVIA